MVPSPELIVGREGSRMLYINTAKRLADAQLGGEGFLQLTSFALQA